MIRQITTFIPNQPGTLASFCKILKENNIDMRAMNVGDAMEFGIVRVIVSDTETAAAVLREKGFVCQVDEVLVIEVEDHPGSLVGLLTTLGEASVNLDYVYALFSRKEGTAGFVIKTGDQEHAKSALRSAGIRQLQEEELTAAGREDAGASDI